MSKRQKSQSETGDTPVVIFAEDTTQDISCIPVLFCDSKYASKVKDVLYYRHGFAQYAIEEFSKYPSAKRHALLDLLTDVLHGRYGDAWQCVAESAYKILERMGGGGEQLGVKPAAGAAHTDPIPIPWLREIVAQKKVRGDSSKLAAWIERQGIRLYKIAGKYHAERADLLRVFRAGSSVHDAIKQYENETE